MTSPKQTAPRTALGRLIDALEPDESLEFQREAHGAYSVIMRRWTDGRFAYTTVATRALDLAVHAGVADELQWAEFGRMLKAAREVYQPTKPHVVEVGSARGVVEAAVSEALAAVVAWLRREATDPGIRTTAAEWAEPLLAAALEDVADAIESGAWRKP